MKKSFKILSIFVISLVVFSIFSSVNAATNDELKAYASKKYTIAGQTVGLNSQDIKKVESYLNQYPVSETDADKIIAKIDEGVALLQESGTIDVSKLSKATKEKLLGIAQDAAKIAGANLVLNSSDKALYLYKDNKKIDMFDLSSYNKGFRQTGSSNLIYVVIGGIVAIITAVVTYRRVKVNA